MNLAHYLFENTAGRTDDFIAGPDEPLSYRAMHECVNSVSYFLSSKLEKGQRVGMFSDNSAFFIIAYFDITLFKSIRRLRYGIFCYKIFYCRMVLFVIHTKFVYERQRIITNFSTRL